MSEKRKGVLTGLKVEEISLVTGDGRQPANPEAKVLFYKAQQKQEQGGVGTGEAATGGDKEQGMNKAVQQAAPAKTADSGAEHNGGLMATIGKALGDYFSKQTRVVEWNDQHTSTSTMKETVDPDPPPATVVVAQSAEGGEQPAEKTAAADPKSKAEPGSETTVVVITEALKAATAPIVKSIEAFDSRLAQLEGKSVGSKKLKSVINGGVEVRDNSGAQFPVFTKELTERLGLTPGQKLTKDVITAGGWTAGIHVEEADRFIDFVVDESAMLPLIRRVPMNGRVRNIDKLALGSTVFELGTPGTDPGDTVTVDEPTQIQLVATEIIAIVSIGDDTLEDNIEGDALVNHLLGMIARAGANEIEQAIIHSDTGGAGAGILTRWDGLLIRAAADGFHEIDGTGLADQLWAGAGGIKAAIALQAMPTKYRRNKDNLRFFVHPDSYLSYQNSLGGLASTDAFRQITDSGDLSVRGVKQVQVPMLATNLGVGTDETIAILTDPRNIIFGVLREIKIEPMRQPRKRATDFVITLRGDVQVENGDAVVVYSGLLTTPPEEEAAP